MSCKTHEFVEPIMEPSPKIKATTPNGRERWVVLQLEKGESVFCPYCGKGLKYD